MHDYESEVRQQLGDFFFRIVLPFLLPLYLLSGIFDWLIEPALFQRFLQIRLTILPVILFGFVIFKYQWKGLWPYGFVWLAALTIALHLTYMAYRTGFYASDFYFYSISLIAGIFLFSPMRLRWNLITLFLIYAAPILFFVYKYMTHGLTDINIPMICLTLAMMVFFGFVATGLDRLRARSFMQKVHLFFLATTDALSGLKLRRYFFHRFIQELSIAFRRGEKLCLSAALIDIDSFKNINDRYGHQVGDQCIRHIGAIIRNNVRVYDTACRLGGEEFIILLPETNLEGARIVSERIRQSVQMSPVKKGNDKIETTVSIGLSGMNTVIPPDYVEIQRTKDSKLLIVRHMLEVIRRADEAMYEAKKIGKNCTCLSEPVPLYAELDEKETQSLKSYLVYFDQDLFSVYPEELNREVERVEGQEPNFYPEEFFFRRCVESLSRNFRNPQWHETLALIWVKQMEQIKVRQVMSKMFRATDVISVVDLGLYGVILFEVDRETLRKTFERVKRRLIEDLAVPERDIRMVACQIEYIQPPARLKVLSRKMPVYSDLAQRATEIINLLRNHRFVDDEDLCYFSPALQKKSWPIKK